MSMKVENVDYWTSYIKPVISDLGVALVFGVGYHIFQKFNKETSEEQSKENLKKSVSKWTEATTVQKFNSLITNNADKTMDAYKILHEIEKNSITPDIATYNRLLDMSFKHEQKNTALKLFEELSEPTFPIQPDTITYNILLKNIVKEIQLKENSIEDMKKLIADMKQKKVALNDITYNTAIDGCIEAKQYQYAWELFEEMKQANISPDLYTYSTLIKGLKNTSDVKDRNCERAIELLTMVKSSQSIPLDEILYNSVIDTCSTFNKMHLAEEIFNEMKDKNIKPSVITYSIMIKGYGQNHNINACLKMYKEMKENMIKSNEIIYGCLFNCFVKGNKPDLLDLLSNDMLKDKIKPNVIINTTLIKGYAKSKQYDKAFNLFYMLRDEGFTSEQSITLYNAIMDCCVESGRFVNLKKIFEELTLNAKNSTGNIMIQPNVITYSIMIKGLAKNGENEEAKKIYEFVLNNFDELDEVLFNTIADAFAKVGLEETALSILAEMKKRNIPRSSIIYSILLKMYSFLKSEEKCLEVFKMMKNDNVKPSIISYTTLMQMYIKKKKMNEAIEIFNDLKSSGIEVDYVSYNFIINGCTFNQKLEKAIELLQESMNRHIHLSEDTYNNVLNYLLENKFMKYQVRAKYSNELLKSLKDNKINIRSDLYQNLMKIVYTNKDNNRELEHTFKKDKNQSQGGKKIYRNYNN